MGPNTSDFDTAREYGEGHAPGSDMDAGVDTAIDPCTGQGLVDCNPVTNEGCGDAGAACDYGEVAGAPGFHCYGDCEAPAGAACDEAMGPWCVAGCTCFDGRCEKFCCDPSDCPTGTCIIPNGGWPGTSGTLGLCLSGNAGTD